MTTGQSEKPVARASFLGFEMDELAYVVPMFVFLGCIALVSFDQSWYPWAYAGRTVVVGLLLLAFSRYYTTIRWNHWWLGILMGILGIVQWIGMDEALRMINPSFFALSKEPFDPTATFKQPLALWAWLTIRIFGASFVVPIMEELFWRDYLWRRLAAPADFQLAKVGEWDPIAFFGVAAAFCVVHPQWLTAIGWGLMIGGLLLYTKSLGACILMHATTNLLLAVYVLKTQQWAWW